MTEPSPYATIRPSLPKVLVHVKMRGRRAKECVSAFDLPQFDQHQSSDSLTPQSDSEGRYSPIIEYPPVFSPNYITRPLKCLRSRQSPEKLSAYTRIEDELRKRAAFRTRRLETKHSDFFEIAKILHQHKLVDRKSIYREVKEVDRSPKRLPPLGLYRRRTPSPTRSPKPAESVRRFSKRPQLSLLVEAFSYSANK